MDFVELQMDSSYGDVILTVAVVLSTISTIVLLTLPSRYSRDRKDEAKENSSTKTKVQIIVLGDIGRSPRMQYHALSFARHGCKVEIVGILESDVHPDINKSQLIKVVPIIPAPSFLQTNNRLLVLAFAPLKAIWQALALYYVLGYQCQPAEWMLLQNPPFIPTFTISSFVAFVRNSKLVIDWHNFGYSLYSLKFGNSHPLVRFHRWYELHGTQSAFTHLTVTNAMARFLKNEAKVIAHPLHDRPPNHFQPLSSDQRQAFLARFGPTQEMSRNGARPKRLIVSSTSWTPDEDFSIFLEALVQYSAAATKSSDLPDIIAIITGKGPQKEHYLSKIKQLTSAGKLQHVDAHTAWLSNEDYASLLGSADLGVSLHTSSSGLDLPMKVVDMFGTGLPVVGWSKFEAWPELVQEGINGRGFDSADGLAALFEELCHMDSTSLQTLRNGAMKECDKRWDQEWDSVASRVFGLVG